jgi:diguanylate cyclase (GGDEF)-like protein
MFNAVLQIDYLYDTNDVRLKTNMKILVAVLAVSSVINSITSTIISGYWSGLAEVAATAILGALFYLGIKKQKQAKNAATMVSWYVTLNIWVQFIFSPYVNINSFLFLMYPVALCLFMGNWKGIGRTILVACNLTLCFWVWRHTLEIAQNRGFLIQFIIAFIFISIFAITVELVHEKMLSRITFLTRQTTDDSFTDALTRLLTRRAFNEQFAKNIEEEALKGDNIFVIICDIDHFKSVNDTYGHNIGDEVLKHVADILSKYAMGKDVCFRWGGEEFLIFLNERSMTRAVDAANRIRVVLEFTHFTSATTGTIKITMSFGLHQYDKSMSMEKNISVADGYLYAAKQNGRNRVEYAK